MKPKMARRFIALALSAVMILESGVISLAAETNAAFENVSGQEKSEAESIDSLSEAAEKEEKSEKEIKESFKDEREEEETRESLEANDSSSVEEKENLTEEKAESKGTEENEEDAKDESIDNAEDGIRIEEDKEANKSEDNAESPEKEDPESQTEKKPEIKTDSTDKSKYPAQRFIKRIGDVKIFVEAPYGAFPEGTRLKIKKVKSSAVLDEIKEASGKKHISKSDIRAYDFNFYTEEEENIEPLEEISVRFTNINVKEDAEISVFHMDGDKSPAEQVDADYSYDDSGTVELSASDFSIYAILESTADSEDLSAATLYDAKEEDPGFGNTANYDSSINLADGKDSFYGGEFIYLYNEISISGNEARVPAGSYTEIRLSKDKFTTPAMADISSKFERIDKIEITSDDSDYVIKTIYKELYGGYVGSTPLKASLKAGKTENLEEAYIKQAYYSPKGKKLSESELRVFGKARLEYGSSNSYTTEAFKTEQADDKYILKEGTTISFGTSYINWPNSNEIDPRGRRVYVTVPKDTKIKENTGWTYDAKTAGYFKDINRRIDYSDLNVILDVSGNDFSQNDTPDKSKEFIINYSLSPLKDGAVQSDLGPTKWHVTKSFYLPKKNQTPDAYHYIYTDRQRMYIGKNYDALEGRKWNDYASVNVPYDSSLISEIRIAFEHNLLSGYSVYNPKDDSGTWKFTIKSSITDVPGYTYPSELRLYIRGFKEGDDSTEALKEKLEGTKAYGIKYDGTKTLLSENVPIMTSFEKSTSIEEEGLIKIDGSEYKSIEFVYPGDGIVFTGKDEIQKNVSKINTLVIADIRPDIVTDLKKLMDENKIPEIQTHTRNSQGYATYDDRSYLNYEFKYKVKDDDTEQTVKTGSASSDTDTYFRLQYEEISVQNRLGLTNGTSFYVDDTVTTRTTYKHTRNGSFADATEPENLNVYYLVPDGLEPIEEHDYFESIEVVKGYLPGKNLIIAKPKKLNVPYITDSNRNLSSYLNNNDFLLSFKVTERLDIGTYNIKAAVSYDNNRIDVKNGRQYGILNSSNPGGDWANINKNARNRPEDPLKFTDLGTSTISIYPPKALVPMKYVKLSSEPDSSYGSSVGKKATIGTEIDYRWRLQNNSTQAINNLTVIDILPYAGDKAIVENEAKEYPSRGSKFKTPLISVEPQEKFDIYYSTDAVKGTTDENRDADWKDNVEDMSEVTMIKAVLKPGQIIDVNEKYDIITHNYIENDNTIKDGDKAYNSFAISTNNGAVFVEGLKTEVSVNYLKRDVILKKTDEYDSTMGLEGVTFDLYQADDDKLIKANLKTDRNGLFTIPDLLVGKDYYLIETSSIEGYELYDEKIPFTVSQGDEAQELTVANRRERTSVRVKKNWIGKESDSTGVILLADGVEKERASLSKDEGWSYTFTDLIKTDPDTGKEINYTVEEAGADSEGRVRLSDGIYSFSISGNAVDGYTITNRRLPDPEPKPEETELFVSKEWNNTDTKNAPEVKAYLVKNGVRTDRFIMLNSDNNWSGSFDRLPIKEKKSDDKENVYTVAEDGEVSGKVILDGKTYRVSYEGGKIINTLIKGSGRSSGGGGGGGGGGKNTNPIPSITPQPVPETSSDTPVEEVPGYIPPVPWYKLPVMGDTQFGPGFAHESKDDVRISDTEEEREVIDQLKGLYEQNSDLSGWLKVPGTGFGYPVMESPYAPYYYLHHTFLKNEDDVGIPFTGPYSNAGSMNVLIHGHNMKDVSQFGYIWNYQYKSFRDKNPLIDFKTLYDDNGSYEVMAVFFAPEYPEDAKDVFWWYRYIGDMNKEQFEYFVKNVKSASLYDTGVDAEYGDRLITLETCASTTDSTRLVVVAKKMTDLK